MAKSITRTAAFFQGLMVCLNAEAQADLIDERSDNPAAEDAKNSTGLAVEILEDLAENYKLRTIINKALSGRTGNIPVTIEIESGPEMEALIGKFLGTCDMWAVASLAEIMQCNQECSRHALEIILCFVGLDKHRFPEFDEFDKTLAEIIQRLLDATGLDELVDISIRPEILPDVVRKSIIQVAARIALKYNNVCEECFG